MQKNVCSILRLFLVILFLGYYGGSTLFIHTHTVDGVVITHSHPYLPSGHHTHMPSGFQVIDHLTYLIFIGGVGCCLFMLTGIRFLSYVPVVRRIGAVTFSYCRFRGPPIY